MDEFSEDDHESEWKLTGALVCFNVHPYLFLREAKVDCACRQV